MVKRYKIQLYVVKFAKLLGGPGSAATNDNLQ